MEDVVERAFELRWRQGLLTGSHRTPEECPMFDGQDERELNNKMDKIKQYYQNWLDHINEKENK